MSKNIPTSILLRQVFVKIIGKFHKLTECPVIFCYHSVSDGNWTFNVTNKNLESQINELSKTKNIVSLNELLIDFTGNCGKKIAITFDDGYQSVFVSAFPVLKKHGVTACVFINKVLQDDKNIYTENIECPMTVKQIINLKSNGWEIGYHTKSHLDLRFVGLKKLEDEIIGSKRSLEKKLGFNLNYFSYPFGAFSKEVINIVKKAGYKYAFSADGGKIILKNFPYKIGRVILDKYTKKEDLKVLTSCQGLFVNRFFTSCLRVKDDLFLSLKKFQSTLFFKLDKY